MVQFSQMLASGNIPSDDPRREAPQVRNKWISHLLLDNENQAITAMATITSRTAVMAVGANSKDTITKKITGTNKVGIIIMANIFLFMIYLFCKFESTC